MKSRLVAFLRSPLLLYYVLTFVIIPAVGFLWLDSDPNTNSNGSIFVLITLFSPAVPFYFYMNQITASDLTFKTKYWQLLLPNLIYLAFISAIYTGFLLQHGYLEYLYLLLFIILLIDFTFLFLGLKLVHRMKSNNRKIGCVLTSILLFCVNLIYVIGGFFILLIIIFTT